MKIIITGGAGFIGSAIARIAITRGHSVVNVDALPNAACLDNLTSLADSQLYRFEPEDIRDRATLDALFAAHKPDAVMHLAAESHVDRSIDGPGTFIDTNITGTYRLLEASRAYWYAAGKPDGFRFHHVSTDEVFGSLGGENEVRNIDLVRMFCAILDRVHPADKPYASLLTYVTDRPCHDARYAIDPTRIRNEWGGPLWVTLEQWPERIVSWCLNNEHWWQALLSRDSVGQRLGVAK